MKHLFIVNPTAGGKDRSAQIRAQVEAAFREREDEYEVYVTRAPRDATDKIILEAETGEHLRVYACGGTAPSTSASAPRLCGRMWPSAPSLPAPATISAACSGRKRSSLKT